MCGINGFNWNNKELIKKMNDKIKHRGPDDEGYFIDDYVSMGHVRLSIIDLSEAGHQPMCNETGDVWIVYNGEIYNFKEIRNELEEKGYQFKSNTDTEVVIHAYEEWGTKSVEKFNGMWAFVIYDKKRKELFFSRDRFGIKPFYYYYDGNNIIFSSEIKPILEYDLFKKIPNDAMIFDFLYSDLLDHMEDTFFKGIKRLLPGHNAIFDLNKRTLKKWKYYDLKTKIKENKMSKENLKFKKLFFNAVKRRLVADVPVGSCLSGGLDSSSIVCTMRKINLKNEIKVFSLVFPGLSIDESKYQEDVIEKCSVERYTTTFTSEDILKDIEDLIYTQEEPFGTLSIYGQYRVMKLARENNMKVLLDGQGSDEILAGYHHFFGNYFYELFKKFRFKTLLKEIYTYYYIHKNLVPLEHFLTNLLPPKITKLLLARKNRFLKKEFINTYKNRKSKEVMWKIENLKESLYLAEVYYSLPRLLRFEDKNAMRWSIESRVPFCDHNLVEYILSLPAEAVIKEGTTKIILRESLKDVLPDSIYKRMDKMAFATPDKTILRSVEGEKFLKDIINSETFRKRKYWNYDAVKKMVEKHLNGRKNYEKTLWKIIIVELWLRMFIDLE